MVIVKLDYDDDLIFCKQCFFVRTSTCPNIIIIIINLFNRLFMVANDSHHYH